MVRVFRTACWCNQCAGTLKYSISQIRRHVLSNGRSENAPNDSSMNDGESEDEEEEGEEGEEGEDKEEEEDEEDDEDDDEDDEEEEEKEDDDDEDVEDEEAEDKEEELEKPSAWLKFSGAGAAWPPGKHADASDADVAMGCMLHLLRLQSIKSLSGRTLEAMVLMWKSLGQPWADLLPIKAQSIRK